MIREFRSHFDAAPGHEREWALDFLLWDTVVVDDDEALRRGPFEGQADAEKAARKLVAEIRNLDDEGMRLFIADRGLPTRH